MKRRFTGLQCRNALYPSNKLVVIDEQTSSPHLTPNNA